MPTYKRIFAACPVSEPPNIFLDRIEPSLRNRAPQLIRQRTPDQLAYAWVIEGVAVATLEGAGWARRGRIDGPVKQYRSESWDTTYTGAHDAHAMLREIKQRGIWGSVLQPNLSLLSYRLADSLLLSEICRVYNDWMADFCKADADRLKGIAMLNVDDVGEACRELERCARLGLVGAFIPTIPLLDRRYHQPYYDALWTTAEELDLPLLLHEGTQRGERGHNVADVDPMTGQVDLWGTDEPLRQTLTGMILGGIFERFPRLRVGSVCIEPAWIPRWLGDMNEAYLRGTTPGLPRLSMLPSEYWHRNLFVQFSRETQAVRLRDAVGVDDILWGGTGSSEASGWTNGQEWIYGGLEEIPPQYRRKIAPENVAKMIAVTGRAPPLTESRSDMLSSSGAPKVLLSDEEARTTDAAVRRTEKAAADSLGDFSHIDSEEETIPEPSVEAPRRVNAWIEDGAPPLVPNRQYRLGVNIGKRRVGSVIGEEFGALDWGRNTTLTLMVVASGSDFVIEDPI